MRQEWRFILAVPLFVGIACSPIPFGSNIDWAWSPLAVIAGITLVL
ncbi:MAG: hypothetical protein JSS04_11385, partial [Proteobacteria bacterium]|nr:hypothetical protein [Pseudomonadota bacterium]